MSSSGRIFLITTEASTLRVSAFDFSVGLSSITPVYYNYFGPSPALVGSSYVFDSIYSSVYIGGTTSGLPSVTKIMLNSGSSFFSYSFTVSGGNPSK